MAKSLFLKGLLFLAAVALLFVCPLRAPAQSVDRIVAVVNGEIITWRQLENRVNSLMNAPKPPKASREEVRQMMLDALIEQELINQAAKTKGVFITEADISDTINSIKKDNNLTDEQFRASLVNSGTSLEAFREDVRVELLRNRVLGAQVLTRVVVTDKEVAAFLNGRGPEGLTAVRGSRQAIRLIALPVEGDKQVVMEKAARIQKEIEGGLSFAEAAYKYSRGPGFDKGGDPGEDMDLSTLPEQLVEMIFSLKPGQPTEPIDGGNAIFIFTRAESTEALASAKRDEDENFSLTEFSSEEIENARRQLERHKMQQRYVSWVTDMKKKAIIKKKL